MATHLRLVQLCRPNAPPRKVTVSMNSPVSDDPLFGSAGGAGLDPFDLFEDWLAAAQGSEINDPHAMALATVDSDGMPDVRMVLLNARDRRGFCFFTNFQSQKGGQLLGNGKAAFVMHWKSLRRQIRVRGPVEQVSQAEADTYWDKRPRGSRIASSASAQSRPLASRDELATRVADLERASGEGEVPRPPHWSGFRVIPLSIEFWNDGAFRLHDRIRFTRTEAGDDWLSTRLYP